MENANLFNTFKVAAEAVGAVVHKAANPLEAAGIVSRIMEDLSVTRVVSVATPLEQELKLAEVLASKNVQLNYDNMAENSFLADAGVAEVDLAVAEIGSLCQKDCSNINLRLASTLPTTHIALVRTSGLVKDLPACMNKIYEEFGAQLPGYMAFITGPSRTADIERVLTIGVHGPKSLYIVFVDSDSAEGGNSLGN